MQPGRELDALIAEKVMGLECDESLCGVGNLGNCGVCDPEPYSNDEVASDELTRELIRKGFSFAAQMVGQEKWEAWFDGENYVTGKSMPHAICLAALKAAGAL